MDRSRIAIVIPALNEAASIVPVIERARQFGLPIVVDDGSSDQTAVLARGAGAEVVSHVVNRGYDAALNSGFARAAELNMAYMITLDADGQHDPLLVQQFMQLLDGGAEIVVGARDKRARLAEHVFAFVARLLYGVRDPLCGMKAYRASLYRALGHFDSYGSIGTELTLFAAKNGFTMAQVDLPVRDRADAPRFGRTLAANMKIFRALALGMVKVPRMAPERLATLRRERGDHP
ncbi:MAG: glycosyltransferase family 2 protein [Pseudomonadota bacterium]